MPEEVGGRPEVQPDAAPEKPSRREFEPTLVTLAELQPGDWREVVEDANLGRGERALYEEDGTLAPYESANPVVLEKDSMIMGTGVDKDGKFMIMVRPPAGVNSISYRLDVQPSGVVLRVRRRW